MQKILLDYKKGIIMKSRKSMMLSVLLLAFFATIRFKKSNKQNKRLQW